MNKIYESAYLIIIAAAGDNCEYGLPGAGNQRRPELPTLTLNGVKWGLRARRLKGLVQGSKWYTRAWTYQEAFFSTRRLVFTEEQVFFECNSCQALEDSPIAIPAQIEPEKYRVESLVFSRGSSGNFQCEDIWMHIQRYSKRNLSKEADIIKAFRGILTAFSQLQIQVWNWWGVPSWAPGLTTEPAWEHLPQSPGFYDACFAVGLFWSSFISVQHRRIGFPTWSWVGWQHACTGPYSSSVHYPSGFSEIMKRGVKIWFARSDGTFERASKDVLAKLTESNTLASKEYLPILQIEAWVMGLSLQVDRAGFFVALRHEDKFDENGAPLTIIWRSYFVSEEVGQKLKTPLKGKVECLQFSEGGIGIIVKKNRDGYRERVCHFPLISTETSIRHDKGEFNLQDFFPSERRTIIVQ